VVIDITARKQAEEVIRKIDEQFRTLATIAPVGIYLADPAGSCLYANPEWCHVSGMQLAEALGNGWREGLHPADREQFAKNWNRMVASKGQWGMEYRFMTRDGTVTWVYGLAAAQYDTAGNVAQYVGINLDITARKATEAALLEKQALLKQAEKLGKIGGWEFDIDTGRQTWTEAVYAIHELDTYIPVHPTVEEGENYYTPESRPLIERAVQRAIGQGEAFDLELEIITAQGNPRSVHVIGGADQAHRKISGFIQDITERKQMENIHRFLGQTISGISGEAFFPALARFLAEILRMDFICIDRLEGDGLTARTEAVWCDGKFEDNVTYALKDTPCGDVVGKHVCCFPSKVCQFFPRDQVLQDLRAESYAGTTLFDHTGKPNGLIAVISRNPLASRELVVTTLQMVAVRAAGELERLQAEEAVRLNEAMLRESQRIAGMGSYVLDIPVGTWRSSEVLDEVFGIDAAYDCSVEGWAALIHPADRSMMLDHFRNDVLGRNQPFDKEYRIIRQHDHAERWVHGLGRLEYDTHENPVRMLGTIQDITERKQAAILLQRQAEELRASNNELEIFNRAVVGRELRMIELKAEINELCRRLREAPRYATDLSESNSSPGATTPHPPASA
jgi:PAS domain S-box-containing protein